MKTIIHHLEHLMWMALILNFLTAIYAAIELRPLFNEGIQWLFEILDNGTFFFDAEWHRYADVFAQVPVVFVTRYLADVIPTSVPVFAFSFPYALQPFLFLILSILLLIWHRRKDLIPICLLSYALASQPVAPAALMAVLPAMGFFWMIFLLLILNQHYSWKNFAIAAPLLISLAFSYEGATICFATLGLVLAFRMLKRGVYPQDISYLLLIVAGFAWLVYSALSPHDMATMRMAYSLRWDAYRIYDVVAAALMIVVLGSFLLELSYYRIVLLTGAVIAMTITVWVVLLDGHQTPWIEGELWHSKLSRIASIPIACGLAGVVAIFELREKGQIVFGVKAKNFLVGCATLFLITSAIHDFRLTRHWKLGLDALQAYVSSSPKGCHLLDMNQGLDFLGRHSISIDRISELSLILQRTRTPNKIYFVGGVNGMDSCEVLKSVGKIKTLPGITLDLNCKGYWTCDKSTSFQN